MSEPVGPEDVLKFWFGEPATTDRELGAKVKRWFTGGPDMDREVKSLFEATVEDALADRRDSWLEHPKGWLALVLVLDQLTRNTLRDDPRMYEGDARAQALSLAALDDGRTDALPIAERHFALLPLTHSEILAHQERSVAETARLVEAAPAAFKAIYGMAIEQSRKYLDVVTRFGRFPHRNRILGRASTPEEVEFLRDWAAKQPPARATELTNG